MCFEIRPRRIIINAVADKRTRAHTRSQLEKIDGYYDVIMNHSYLYVPLSISLALSLADTYGHFQRFRLHLFHTCLYFLDDGQLFGWFEEVHESCTVYTVQCMCVTLCPETLPSPKFRFWEFSVEGWLYILLSKIRLTRWGGYGCQNGTTFQIAINPIFKSFFPKIGNRSACSIIWLESIYYIDVQ